jgi:folate-dependent tRNA-U54 methylase TrmFO/GidA
MLGALYRYMREADPAHFQPMNANFGLLDDLEHPTRDKQVKRQRFAARSLARSTRGCSRTTSRRRGSMRRPCP